MIRDNLCPKGCTRLFDCIQLPEIVFSLSCHMAQMLLYTTPLTLDQCKRGKSNKLRFDAKSKSEVLSFYNVPLRERSWNSTVFTIM
jgi:hypothetical protein